MDIIKKSMKDQIYDLLRERIYPLLRAAARFLADYMTRPGSDPVGDGKYHLYRFLLLCLGPAHGYGNRKSVSKDGGRDRCVSSFPYL